MIVFHAIFARKHGEKNGYPVIAAFGPEGHTAVLDKYTELTGTEGASFRAENAEMELITIDGDTFRLESHHSFEDPKTLAARRERVLLDEALKTRAEQTAAQAAFDAARDRVGEAKEGLKTLTPAQKKLLADYDEKAFAAQVKANELSGDEKAQRAASAAEQTRQRAAEIEQRSKALGVAIDSTGALGDVLAEGAAFQPVPGSESADDDSKALEDCTIEELKELAAQENVDLTGLSLKADLIAAIELNRAPLDARTIPQLQALAASKGIDLTGISLKADIISAIETSRSAPPASDPGPTL